jgi:hypothetical protein
MIPTVIPIVNHTTAAPSASEIVAGRRWRICVLTLIVFC